MVGHLFTVVTRTLHSRAWFPETILKSGFELKYGFCTWVFIYFMTLHYDVRLKYRKTYLCTKCSFEKPSPGRFPKLNNSTIAHSFSSIQNSMTDTGRNSEGLAIFLRRQRVPPFGFSRALLAPPLYESGYLENLRIGLV